MAVPTLPADLQNPWGQVLRDALVDISNRADQGINDANDVGADLDDQTVIVSNHTSTLSSYGSRLTAVEASDATKAADNAVVKLAGNQTISGVKTFNTAPVVPDNSFAISKVTNLQTTLNAKAPLAQPTFVGPVGGLSKSDVGLTLADNTADVDKPISTATQTALNTKVGTSDLTSAISTHNHSGGANGVNIPQASVTGLVAALNAKQNAFTVAGGQTATYNTARFTVDYFYMYRRGSIAYVSIKFTTKFSGSAAAGDIPNEVIATINSSSQFADIYRGISGENQTAMLYSLSSQGTGMSVTGMLNSATREFVLTATNTSFSSGTQLSLGGMFFLNSDV